jgi:hypothetical protein
LTFKTGLEEECFYCPVIIVVLPCFFSWSKHVGWLVILLTSYPRAKSFAQALQATNIAIAYCALKAAAIDNVIANAVRIDSLEISSFYTKPVRLLSCDGFQRQL